MRRGRALPATARRSRTSIFAKGENANKSHYPPHKVPISSWNRSFSFICELKSTEHKSSNLHQLIVLCAPKSGIFLHKTGCYFYRAEYRKKRLTQIWPKREILQKKCRVMVSKAERLPLRNTRMCDNMLVTRLENKNMPNREGIYVSQRKMVLHR